MFRTILFSIFAFSVLQIFAQNKDQLNSFDFYYGYNVYLRNFYQQFNTIKKFEMSNPIQQIGLGANIYRGGTNKKAFWGHYAFCKVIPQSIYITDSIKCKVTGFSFSASYGGAITNRSRRFSLYYYAGFNTGRLRIYGNETVRQRNPFFAPKIGLQPKIKLGNLVISFISEYVYDVSKPSWKRTRFSNNNKIQLDDFKQSGMVFQIGLGYTVK